jgi:hypothetical protein
MPVDDPVEPLNQEVRSWLACPRPEVILTFRSNSDKVS